MNKQNYINEKGKRKHIVMRNIDAALSTVWKYNTKMLTTKPPCSARLRLLLCWGPPRPTLLLHFLSGPWGSRRTEGRIWAGWMTPSTTSAHVGLECSSHYSEKAILLRTPSSYTDFKSEAMRLDSLLSWMWCCCVLLYNLLWFCRQLVKNRVLSFYLYNGVAQSVPP